MNKHNSNRFLGVALVASALSASAIADYGFSADSFTGTGNNGAGYSLGWAFNTSSNINIASLGWYDHGGDGLADSHQVGIFDMTGTLLVSGTVQSGSADPLVGMFRYTNNLTGNGSLAAGQYVVAGVTGSNDFYAWDPVNPVFGSGITFVEDRFSASSSLIFPTTTAGFAGWYGPNFEYVPEPASFIAIGLGLAGLAIARRRK